MKRRKLTWLNWIELAIGCILPTSLLAPPLVVTALIGILGGVATLNLQTLWAGLVMGVLPLGALASLWLVLLFGPDQIQRRPLLRLFVILTGVSGILIGAWMIPHYWETSLGWLRMEEFEASALQDHLALIGLVGALGVGLKYLPSLLWRGNK
ncbi:MAG: hypothetical protein HYY58_04930 [Candidatus Omnitrophica bacterium]|nr:hypothetical protein [Candidatus Omnitrophota bacterium]